MIKLVVNFLFCYLVCLILNVLPITTLPSAKFTSKYLPLNRVVESLKVSNFQLSQRKIMVKHLISVGGV